MVGQKSGPALAGPAAPATTALRIPVRLRIATGTYILQCNRASYNQFESDATCNLCGKSDETLTHFLLECDTLYCSPIYRISLANALPNAIFSKFALIARNSEAFGSICKHSEAFGENFKSLRKLGTCS